MHTGPALARAGHVWRDTDGIAEASTSGVSVWESIADRDGPVEAFGDRVVGEGMPGAIDAARRAESRARMPFLILFTLPGWEDRSSLSGSPTTTKPSPPPAAPDLDDARGRRAARALARDRDRAPRQPRAREPLRGEGRRPPGVERVDGEPDDRALVLRAARRGPRVGEAARVAGAARDQLPAGPPRPPLPRDAARLRRPPELPEPHEGSRPGRLLDRLGRHRRDRPDLGRDRAPLPRAPPLRGAADAAARSPCWATPSWTRAPSGRRSPTRGWRSSARCCGWWT